MIMIVSVCMIVCMWAVGSVCGRGLSYDVSAVTKSWAGLLAAKIS